MRLVVVGLCVALAFVGTANAYFVTGEGLHDVCTDDKADAACQGYLIGLHDGVWLKGNDMDTTLGCLPRKLTPTQLHAIVRKYTTEHPEQWGQPGSVLFMFALKEAFPCD